MTELLQKTMLHRFSSYYTYPAGAYEREHVAGWITAACMLVRRSVYEHVGGFDEGFFMFMEDIDLCARIRATGMEILYTPRASAVHHLGGSQSNVRTSMLLEGERSARRYFLKHYGRRSVSALRALSVFEAILRSAAWAPALLFPRRRPQAIQRLRAYRHLPARDLDRWIARPRAPAANDQV